MSKKTYRLASLILAAVMLLGITACDGDKKQPGDKDGGKTPTTSQQPASTDNPEANEVSIKDIFKDKEVDQKADGSLLGLASYENFNMQTILDSGIFSTDNAEYIMAELKATVPFEVEDGQRAEFRGKLQLVTPIKQGIDGSEHYSVTLDAIGYIHEYGSDGDATYVAIDSNPGHKYPEAIRVHTYYLTKVSEVLSDVLNSDITTALAGTNMAEVELFDGVKYTVFDYRGALDFILSEISTTDPTEITLSSMEDYSEMYASVGKETGISPIFQDSLKQIFNDNKLTESSPEVTADMDIYGIYELLQIKAYKLIDNGAIMERIDNFASFYTKYISNEPTMDSYYADLDMHWGANETNAYPVHIRTISLEYPDEKIENSYESLHSTVEQIVADAAAYAGIEASQVEQRWSTSWLTRGENKFDGDKEHYDALIANYNSLSDTKKTYSQDSIVLKLVANGDENKKHIQLKFKIDNQDTTQLYIDDISVFVEALDYFY